LPRGGSGPACSRAVIGFEIVVFDLFGAGWTRCACCRPMAQQAQAASVDSDGCSPTDLAISEEELERLISHAGLAGPQEAIVLLLGASLARGVAGASAW
jgi:hypothetical protein